MVSLNKEQTCLLSLIKSSLFNLDPVIPENVDWDNVYGLAKVQCIVPLLASCVPSEYRNAWLDITCQSKARYMQMLYEQNSLIRLLNANSIPLVIFKGTAAAVYYPVPSLRTFGDIDFYVSEGDFDLTCSLLEKNGYFLAEQSDRHYSYIKNGMEFELHRVISSIHYKNVEIIYINGLNNSVDYKIENYSFPGLPIYENGLVLLGHIIAHLKQSGIGLRQIIDWMMYVHKELDDKAWSEQFSPFAHEAGLENLAITVTYMCKKWLGLNDEITWCDGADEEVAHELLIRVLDDGNFGQDRAPSENVNKSIKKEGFFKYLQRSGMMTWPLAQKYSFFRPFAWLYQLFRYIGKGLTGVFTGKKVIAKKRNMSSEELLERLE